MGDREVRRGGAAVDRQAIANAFRDILLRQQAQSATPAAPQSASQQAAVREDGAGATEHDRLVPLRHLSASSDERNRLVSKENAASMEKESTSTASQHVNFISLNPVTRDRVNSLSPKRQIAPNLGSGNSSGHGSPNGKSNPSTAELPTISIGVPQLPVSTSKSGSKASRERPIGKYSRDAERPERRLQYRGAVKDIVLATLAAVLILGVIVSSIIVSLKLGGTEPKSSAVSRFASTSVVINDCITVVGRIVSPSGLFNQSESAFDFDWSSVNDMGYKDDAVSELPNVVSSGPVAIFDRVPFAVPPQRWQLAEAIDSSRVCWQLGNSNNYQGPKPDCLNFDASSGEYLGSDDCLYATVMTSQRALSGTSLLPVVVSMATRSYCRVDNSSTLDERLVSQLGAVLVKVPTRVGLLGYMTWDSAQFGYELAYGNVERLHSNVALSDTIAALRFLRAYATRFGGSPSDVVIAANGAAASDLLVLLSAKYKSSGWDAAAFYKALWLSSPALHFAKKSDANANAAKRTETVLRESGCASHAADRISCLRNLSYTELTNLTQLLLQTEPELFSAMRCDNPAQAPLLNEHINVAGALPYAGDADWFSASVFETWLAGSAAVDLSSSTLSAKRNRYLSSLPLAPKPGIGNRSASSNLTAYANRLQPISIKVPILLTVGLDESESPRLRLPSADENRVSVLEYLRNLTSALNAQAGRSFDSTLDLLARNLFQSASRTSWSLIRSALTRVCPLTVFTDFAIVNQSASETSDCGVPLDSYFANVKNVRTSHSPFEFLLFNSSVSDWSLVFGTKESLEPSSNPETNSQSYVQLSDAIRRVVRDSLVYYDPYRVPRRIDRAIDVPSVKSIANTTSSFHCIANKVVADAEAPMHSADVQTDSGANSGAFQDITGICYALYHLAAELCSSSSDQHINMVYLLSQYSRVS